MITVWSAASSAATGTHMSPVSPYPCSNTTAGPAAADAHVHRHAVRRDTPRVKARGIELNLRALVCGRRSRNSRERC